jgi:hypothetical protein
MKCPFLMFFCAVSCAYPQTTLQPVVQPKSDFSARLERYVQKTYTDPWGRFWLVEGAAADDFVFKG